MADVAKITLISLLLGALCCSCNSGKSKSNAGSDSTVVEEFHADNDIAMTVRSIADAISVGEPVTGDYNFSGVLTDGQGRPIYTNLQGTPGTWKVDVLSDSCVNIRNSDLGDLLTDDLESYILSSMEQYDVTRVDSLCEGAEEGKYVSVYDFNGGNLRFEVHNATAPDGREAPLLLITINH